MATTVPSPTDSAPSITHPSTTAATPARPPSEISPFTASDTLGDRLAAAEAALADPDTPPGDFRRWAWVHQQAYRDLVTNPDWQDAVRGRIRSDLRDAFDLNVKAGTHLRELTTPQPGLPDWRIVPAPPVEELRTYYAETEAEFGVAWQVLAAIHLVESRFGRIRGDSHAGAQGPMQFLPSTWAAYGEGDIDDPRDAIMAAGRYLAAHGAPDDLRSALYAYNHSDLYVEAILAHAEAIERYDHYLAVYHQWRVYYRTVDGDVVLEEGYGT